MPGMKLAKRSVNEGMERQKSSHRGDNTQVLNLCTNVSQPLPLKQGHLAILLTLRPYFLPHLDGYF